MQVPDIVVDECLARPDNIDAQRIRQALADGLLLPYPPAPLPGLQPGESAAMARTGKPLSFVYDVADIYNFETVVPMAFKVAAANPGNPRYRAAVVLTHVGMNRRQGRQVEGHHRVSHARGKAPPDLPLLHNVMATPGPMPAPPRPAPGPQFTGLRPRADGDIA